MTKHHLQLLGSRFFAQSEFYDSIIDWVDERIIADGEILLRLVENLLSKDCYRSFRALVFKDFVFLSEHVLFYKSVACCEKVLKHSDTLSMHLLNNKKHRDSEEKDLLAVHFFLHIQVVIKVLKRYNERNDRIDDVTAEHFRKGYAILERILKKPSRRDPTCADTFFQVDVRKWKLIFHYTCGPCQRADVMHCRLIKAVAWIKLYKNWYDLNTILHLEGQLHANNLRDMPEDEMPIREINNNPPLSSAGKYLINVTEYELCTMCTIGRHIARDSPFDKITKYLREQLAERLGEFNVVYFGSRMMETGTEDSDYDILVKSDVSKNSRKCLKRCIGWAKDNTDVEIKRMVIEGVGLLSIYVPQLDATLDLTFGNPHVAANCRLKKYFYELQPTARKLYFLVKTWKREIRVKVSFHDHILAMLVIFFMQQKKYLPSVKSLMIGPLMESDVYNTHFRRDVLALPQPSSMLRLVRNFFSYWAQFDWTTQGISVYEATPLPTASFSFKPDRPCTMMISDFFVQDRNCAANIEESTYRQFVDACVEADAVLREKKKM